jgi:PilZ domain
METQLLKDGRPMEIVQRRRSPRIRLQVPVFLRAIDASGSEFIELTRTVNISANGACIASTRILRPDQIIHLTIPAPAPASSSSLVPSETPPITAKVLRQDAVGELRLFGLEFLRSLE